MIEFFQILMINLAVSCDNVGVIALATKGLPKQQAATARRIGVGLSLILKIVFIFIIGYLFEIKWLHIRIIGGVLLLYVTFNMLKQQKHDKKQKSYTEKNHFFYVIISIVAADISMSIDNVIAILGVVSDSDTLSIRDYALVIGGLILCIPLLLWCSNKISDLMEHRPIITYFCAGYLLYTAIKIILEDESVALFFSQIHFTFAQPTAVLLGILLVVYACCSGGVDPSAQTKRGILPLYILVIFLSLMMVGVISYISALSLEQPSLPYRSIFDQFQQGANAVYLLGMESEALCFCAALLAGGAVQHYQKQGYYEMFLTNMKGMTAFIVLYITVSTTGLTFTFGIGELHPLLWLVNLLLQAALLLVYPALFSLLAVLTQSRVLTAIMGLLYLLIEAILTAICMSSDKLMILEGLLPKYYLSTFALQPLDYMLALRILLISSLYIAISLWVADGIAHKKRTHSIGFMWDSKY